MFRNTLTLFVHACLLVCATEKFPRLCLNTLGYGNEAALVDDPTQVPSILQTHTTQSHPLCQRCDSQAQQQTGDQPGLQIGVNCVVRVPRSVCFFVQVDLS